MADNQKCYVFRVVVEREIEGFGENAEKAFLDAQRELNREDSVLSSTLLGFTDGVSADNYTEVSPYEGARWSSKQF